MSPNLPNIVRPGSTDVVWWVPPSEAALNKAAPVRPPVRRRRPRPRCSPPAPSRWRDAIADVIALVIGVSVGVALLLPGVALWMRLSPPASSRASHSSPHAVRRVTDASTANSSVR